MMNVSKKIISGLMLTAFVLTNTSALALDYAPSLRQDEPETIQLRADISITDSNELVTLSLRESDVKQVLRMFADKTGHNIIFDDSVSGNVTLDLVDVPINNAFELIMSMCKLTYIIQDNTLIIAGADADLNAAQQEITLIPVKYIDASIMADFLNNNIFKMGKPGLSSKDIVSVNPMTNELMIFGTKNDVAISRKIIEKFDRKPSSTTIRLKHTTPQQMADMVCNMLLPASSSATGGAAGLDGVNGIEGIMTGGASSSGSSSIEVGGGEVACSVTSSGSGTFQAMQLQSLSVSYFTQAGTIGIMGGSDSQINMIKEFIAANDIKQPQAYLEISILELNESGSKTLENTWQYLSKNFSINAANGTTGTGIYPIFLRSADQKIPYVESHEDGVKYEIKNYGGYGGRAALTYAINYILENAKGRVVANPRILVTNGQKSTIDLTSDYISKTTSQIVSGGYSSTPTVQREYEIGNDNGIKVTVTPFISPDGYVTLNINPDYATIASQLTSEAEDGSAMDIAVTLLQRRNLELKNVRIKDGETLILGGMLTERESKTVKKIPVLGDLPVIGAVFRSTNTSKEKGEMLIMITPHIIVDAEDDTNDNTLTL